MKLAKISVFAVLVGIIVAMFFVLTGDEKVSNQYVVQQIGSNASSRADDETYAEEVSALIKLNQDKTQEIDILSQNFSTFKNEVVRNVSDIEKASSKRIRELEEELIKAKEGITGTISQTEGSFKAQLEELKKFNKNREGVNQIQANTILGEDADNSKITDLSLPKLPNIVPKTTPANLVVPIPEGNVSIRPYGVKAETKVKKDSDLLGDIYRRDMFK